MLALAIQRRLARGTTDEEIEELIERFKRDNRVVFTVGTLEYLQKGGRIGRAQALAGTLLNVKPILSVADGVIVPIGKVRGPAAGARGVRPRVHRDDPGSAGPPHRDRARRRPGMDRGAHRPRRRRCGRRRRSSWCETLGAVVGTHAGPGAVGFFWFQDA